MVEDTGRLRALRDGIRLFRGCTLEEVRQVLKHANTRFLYDGQLVFREGAPADVLFVIISGHVLVSRGEGTGEAALATLDPGTTVGEMAFIDEVARSARGVAVGDTVVLEFRRDIFGSVDSAVLEKLLRNLFAIIAGRLRAANARPPTGLEHGGPDLSGVELRGAKMNRAVLTGLVAHEVDLRGADLRGADMRGADLRGAQLSGADLRDVDLSGIIDAGSAPPKDVPCGLSTSTNPASDWRDLDAPSRRVRRIRTATKTLSSSGD